MDDSADTAAGFPSSILDGASEVLDAKLKEGEVDPDRRLFLEGVQKLEQGDLEEATKKFRRAARKSPPPFDALARVSRGECERLRGNLGVAIRQWREVAENDNAPSAARYMAWLSIAAAADSRDDDRLLERARRAIDDLESSEEV